MPQDDTMSFFSVESIVVQGEGGRSDLLPMDQLRTESEGCRPQVDRPGLAETDQDSIYGRAGL